MAMKRVKNPPRKEPQSGSMHINGEDLPRVLNNAITPLIPMVYTESEPEVYTISVKDKYFLFDTNSLVHLQVDEEVYKAVDNGICANGEIRNHLFSQKKPMIRCAPMPDEPMQIVLNVTHNCNLACKYCFVRSSYDNQKSMSIETAIRAIDTLFKNTKRQVSVGFFGGEPLLKKKLIDAVVVHVREKNKGRGFPNSHFNVTTNATLINDATAKYLSMNNFSLIVSLDSVEREHNEWRPMKDPMKNSFRETMRGLELLSKYGIGKRVTLRSTFATECDLVERLSFLHQFIKRGMAGHVSVEPAALSESECGCLQMESMESETVYEKLRYEYHRAAQWYVAVHRVNEVPHFHHFDIMLRRVFWLEHALTECGAGKGYISVNPDGQLFACHREVGNPIGELTEAGPIYNGSERQKWYDNRLYYRKGCIECPIRYVCGGGCRSSSVINGDIRIPEKISCKIKRWVYEETLWILSEVSRSRIAKTIHPKSKARRELLKKQRG